MYTLHSRLATDTFYLGRFSLCDVLLMNDARYPWLILVPRRADISEAYQLNERDQQQLMIESSFVVRKLAALMHADKMNVAMLGNSVSQLHIHHIARYKTDETWPAPVWAKGKTRPYSEQERQSICQQLSTHLSDLMRQ